MSNPLKVMGLFSGIGGFELGLQRAGFEIDAMCEINPYCRDVLNAHWPSVPVTNDVTSAEFVEGQADVITAGFPCQNISRAGDGAGLSGANSGLFREVLRAIRVVRPRFTVLENVANLLHRGMGEVCGELAEVGQDCEWDCVPASAVGAPHERDRIWIVAYPDDMRGLQPQRGIGDIWRRLDDCYPASTEWEKPWQEVLSQIQGMDDGLSDRLDKAGCDALGNGLIPQIPEMIGRAILEAAA